MIRIAPIVAGILLAAGCAGSSHAAQLHRHYFLVGKQACKHLVRSTSSSFTIYALDVNSYPAKYRHDVVAGCDAAG
jgi:hypothetical protein